MIKPHEKNTHELVTFGVLAPGDLFRHKTYLYEKKQLSLGTPPANAWNLTLEQNDWLADDEQVVKLDEPA